MSKDKNPFHYNPQKRFDVDENRVLTNEILKAALRMYGDPFGFVTAAFQIEADPLNLLQNAPGITEVLEAAGRIKRGTLSEIDGHTLAGIIDDLLSVLEQARAGDEFAEKRILAIEKLLAPEMYDLPMTAVEQILEKYHTRAALARGWEIRKLMGTLSLGVEPTKHGKSVLEGTVRLTNSPALRQRKTYWRERKKMLSGYEVALEHWPKRGAPTLKSLAIKVYLTQLRGEGFTTISEASLEEDLKELAEWDKTHVEENKRYLGVAVHNAGGETIYLPWQPHSDGWKRSGHYEQNKKPARKAGKGRGKK